jgi:hypothetical protein
MVKMLKKIDKISVKFSSSAVVIVCASLVCCVASLLIGTSLQDSISESAQNLESFDQSANTFIAPEVRSELQQEVFQKKIGFSLCVLVGVLSFVSLCAFFPEALSDVQNYFHHVEPAVVQTTTTAITEAGMLYFPKFTEVHWIVLMEHVETYGKVVTPASYECMTDLFNNMFKDAVAKPVMFKLEAMSYVLGLCTSSNPEQYMQALYVIHSGSEVFVDFIRSHKL